MENKFAQETFSGIAEIKNSVGSWPSPSEENVAECPGCMFDQLTGLPSFNLFEDRLQTALTGELLKDVRMRKFQIAVAGIFIRNLHDIRDEAARDQLLRQTADRLTDALPKNYTVARGINYHFWIIMPNMTGAAGIEVEIDKVSALLSRPAVINSRQYQQAYNIGVGVFDGEAIAPMALTGQAITALQRAIALGDNQVVYFSTMAK